MNGRTKGSKAERAVAALLQAWWGAYEEATFVRTPLSGGWGAPATRAEFRASGDVMTSSTSFPFAVEVKRREGWSPATLYAGKPSPVWSWWRQAQTQAIELQLEPMLWYRQSREPWTVMLSARFAQRVKGGRLLGDHAWDPTSIIHLDVGEHPVAFLATRLLERQPTHFLGVK